MQFNATKKIVTNCLKRLTETLVLLLTPLFFIIFVNKTKQIKLNKSIK